MPLILVFICLLFYCYFAHDFLFTWNYRNVDFSFSFGFDFSGFADSDNLFIWSFVNNLITTVYRCLVRFSFIFFVVFVFWLVCVFVFWFEFLSEVFVFCLSEVVFAILTDSTFPHTVQVLDFSPSLVAVGSFTTLYSP